MKVKRMREDLSELGLCSKEDARLASRLAQVWILKLESLAIVAVTQFSHDEVLRNQKFCDFLNARIEIHLRGSEGIILGLDNDEVS